MPTNSDRTRLPWYRWFPYDAARDEVWSAMSFSDRGIFHALLDHQWIYGSVPADPYQMAKAIGARYDTMKSWLSRWHFVMPCVTCGVSHYTPNSETTRTNSETTRTQPELIRTQTGDKSDTTCTQLANPKLWIQQDTDTREEESREDLEESRGEQTHACGRESGFESESVDSPAPQVVQAPPVPPEPKVPVPSKSEASSVPPEPEAPASATPKKEKTPAEKAATYLFVLLGKPKKFQNPETYRNWVNLMKKMLDESGAELDDLKAFLKFNFEENVSEEDKPAFTANWLPKAKDPCQTLYDKFTDWLWPDWEQRKKLRAKLASKKQKSVSTSDTEKAALDLINSLSGQQ